MATPVTDKFDVKKVVKAYTDTKEITIQVIEFVDKSIVQIYNNGEIDSTIDIQLPALINSATIDEEEEETLESKIKASYIIGNVNNLKGLILATQLGKLLVKLNKNEKSIILNSSSKIFDEGELASDKDFDVLMFILVELRSLLSK